MITKNLKFIAGIVITFVAITLVINSNALAEEAGIGAEAQIFAQKQANEVASIARNSSAKKFIQYLNNNSSSTLAIGYMGMWALGANGKLFNSQQKTEYIAAFKEYLINFYGNVLYQNRNSQFTFVGVTERGANSALVDFKVVVNNQDISIVWEVRKSVKENKLLVTDFIVNGISFLQAKRTEYSSILQNNNNVDDFINTIKHYNQNQSK